MSVLGNTTLNFPSSGFTIGDGGTNWIQGDSSKNIGLGTSPTQKFHVQGNIKSTQVHSSGYYGPSGTGGLYNGITFNNSRTTVVGQTVKYDPISGGSYTVHEQQHATLGTWDVVGSLSFDNATTAQFFVDLRPYLVQSFAFANYVLVQSAGIWIAADNSASYYVSRICSMSFSYNDNVANPVWSRSNLDSPFADNNDGTNFPVSTRIYPLLWNDVTGGTTAGSGGVLTPQIRFYRRATAATTGTCYYTYRLFVLNG